MYCAVVLDAYSRRVVGWPIDSSPTSALVANALGWPSTIGTPRPAVLRRPVEPKQFTSWAFTQRAKDSGLVPSMGSVGDFDNAMMESFWPRMRVELLDLQRWRTRMELANAIFEYFEIWHKRQRRHSQLDMLNPIEYQRRRLTVA